MPSINGRDAQAPSFPTLEARIERVADATIRKKWKKLPASSHSAARDALSVARLQSRSRRGKTKTNQTVEDCVDDILNRLQDRLPRIPYPPATDENHFDHEANLNRANRLDNQLAEHAHAMKLLQEQIVEEENWKTAKEEELKGLEKNAVSAEQNKRLRSQNFHPVAKELGQHASGIDIVALSQQKERQSKLGISSLYADEELMPVLEQLENHLDSISQNVQDVAVVTEVVRKAQHELQVSGSHHG